MIEDIVFENKSRGASEIRLQHSTGEVTVLGFAGHSGFIDEASGFVTER